MTDLSVVFAGSPAAAVPSLRALASSAHSVTGVLTRHDSRQGRRGILTPTPVASAAEQLGLVPMKANRLDDAVTDSLAALRPDLGVIVAYGALVREPLLSLPRLGWINLHFSLLPRWRGAAPVQRAIIAGDRVTGASVFQLVPELDAGDVYGRISYPIGGNETAGHLLAALAEEGAGLLTRVVSALANGTAVAEPQAGEVTLAPKLTLEDGRIDWRAPGYRVHDLIRGVTPEPGAFTTLDGSRLKVLDAALARDAAPIPPGEMALVGSRVLVGTADEPVEVISVQPEGKRVMGAADWWRGRPVTAQRVAG